MTRGVDQGLEILIFCLSPLIFSVRPLCALCPPWFQNDVEELPCVS
jgi:hypothetical protein